MAVSVETLLPFIRPGWVGAEVGVAQGDSALALFLHGVRFLYLIDPWAPYGEQQDRTLHEENYKEAMEKLSPYAGRHAHLRMTSSEAARHVHPQLDFVWLDGDHRYEWVRSDIDLYWPKLRPGGLLCGHDYCNSLPHCEVKRAVDEWVGGNKLMLELAPPCWLVRKP